MKNVVTKADGIKLDETLGQSTTNGGVRPLSIPRPKRRKGYYRALKRGELWALVQNNLETMSSGLARYMFGAGKK